MHRASTPSQLAAGRPRYSLVWKLALWAPGPAAPPLARPEWGPPLAFGSARRAEEVRVALRAKAQAGGGARAAPPPRAPAATGPEGAGDPEPGPKRAKKT